MSNSSLVSYTNISPNRNSPRNHVIDTITIHCYVGQASVESMGGWFAQSGAQASSNYGIGFDGRIGLFVEEKDRSWCSSSRDNDNRAVTIECACEPNHPYAVNDAVYRSLIDLVTDICKRNGIKKLLWKADKSLIGQVDKQNMTVHRWFANKACPGDYLYERHGDIATKVNAKLGNPTSSTKEPISTKEQIEKKNAPIIWKFFKDKGLNDYAVAGIMGNLRAESALNPENMQDSFEQKLGYTDATYTKAVSDGTCTKNDFIYDCCGYGLAQWTFWSRKSALYDYAKSKHTSIGNLQMQLDFLWSELQNYKSLMQKLKTATSVKEASDAVLFDFEKPGNIGTAVQNTRAEYGNQYYKQFVTKDTQNDTSSVLYKIQVGAFSKKDNAELL